MKKLSLIVFALIALVFAAQAQNKAAKTPKTPEQKAEKLTQKWTPVLSLTEAQIPKVKSIFLDRAQKVQALKAKYPADTDKAARREEAKKIKMDSENSLKQVLTPAQYDTYVKTKEEKKAQRKNQGKAKSNGKSKPAPANDDDDDDEDDE